MHMTERYIYTLYEHHVSLATQGVQHNATICIDICLVLQYIYMYL